MTDDFTFPPSTARVAELERIGAGWQAELFVWPPGGVVKLFLRPEALGDARDEVATIRRLATARLPMPQLFGTVTIEGRPGIIMEHLVGPDLVTFLGRRPWAVWSVGDMLGRLHAELHAAPAPEGLLSLKASLGYDLATTKLVCADLKALAAADLDRLPEGTAICHGDFQPANVIVTASGPKIIDWASTRQGDPLGDVARTQVLLQGSALRPGTPFLLRALAVVGRTILVRRYLRAYRRHRPFRDRDLAAWIRINLVSQLSYGVAEDRAGLLKMSARYRGDLTGHLKQEE